MCVPKQGRCVCVCLACALFEFTFTNVPACSHTIVHRPAFPGACLSICNFDMTGLLSVFSLLPVQTLKKGKDSQEEVEEDPGGLKETRGGKLSTQEDGESSDTNTERYSYYKSTQENVVLFF